MSQEFPVPDSWRRLVEIIRRVEARKQNPRYIDYYVARWPEDEGEL